MCDTKKILYIQFYLIKMLNILRPFPFQRIKKIIKRCNVIRLEWLQMSLIFRMNWQRNQLVMYKFNKKNYRTEWKRILVFNSKTNSALIIYLYNTERFPGLQYSTPRRPLSVGRHCLLQEEMNYNLFCFKQPTKTSPGFRRHTLFKFILLVIFGVKFTIFC